MKTFKTFHLLAAILTVMLLTTSAAYAQITVSGDVSPTTDPSTWPDYAYGYIGKSDTGSLSITNGSSMLFDWALTGFESGVNGAISVDGDGSSLANSVIFLGYNGTGSLSVTNGASVSANSVLYMGYEAGSSGTAVVDGNGSALSATGTFSVGENGTGAMAVTNGGSLTSGYSYVGFTDGTGTVTVDGDGSTWTTSERIQVGVNGTGTLSITNGGSVITNSFGSIGAASYGNGKVTVDGEGSSWAMDDYLKVGATGNGTLVIANGGSVSSTASIIGNSSNYGGTGTAMVNGEGSSWTTDGSLQVGSSNIVPPGTGTLSVTDKGQVTATSLSVNGNSTMTVDTDSTIKVGKEDSGWTGDIDNNGIVRLVAGAGADTGTYTPMSYGSMTGEGIVQALGGIWDETDHTITVAEAVTAQGSGGATATLDLSQNQRALITDTLTGMSAGAGFLGADTSTIISLTATTLGGDDLGSLESLMAGTGEDILSAWDFSAQGYDADSPVYLSLYAASAEDILNLTIWYLLDGQWTEYDLADLAFDGIYASFTAKGLGKYAVTGASSVPVPGTILLLSTGFVGLIGLRRRQETKN